MFAHRAVPRWLSIVLCFSLAVISSPLPAQSPQELEQVPGLSIRVSSRLVMVDVVVTDKHGQPVLGLKPTDFTVMEKGKPQKISVFTAPDQAVPKPAAPALAPGVYSNRPEYRAPGGPPTVILLDAVNTPAENQSEARTQMMKFAVENFKPGNEVAVLALTNELRILQDFTTDPSILQQAFQRYGTQKPGHTDDPAEAMSVDISGPGVGVAAARVTSRLEAFQKEELTNVVDHRVEITLAALRALSRTLGGIPGRKNVVWLSAGFPFSLLPNQQVEAPIESEHEASQARLSKCETYGCPDPVSGAESSMNPGQQRVYTNQIRSVSAQLASAQIAIYPVDVRGLETATDSSSYSSQQTMKEIAAETGGAAFINRNDIHTGVERAMADHAASYTIGYYPANKNWDGSYRTISVKVNHEGVEVRHRSGYFALDPAKENEKLFAQDLSDAIQDKISATQIPFYAKVSTVEKGKTRVDFMVDGDALTAEDSGKGKHLNLNFEVAIFAPDGKQISSRVMKVDKVLPLETYQQIMQQGLSVHLDVDTPPGRNVAWIAVRDNHNGYVGTLQASIGQ
jgi:VWFA-related protein